MHIADVSAHVRPGGKIEAEAARRGTSVYVPGAVEPMLPEVLSNGACSLRPGEDKLAVTVEMDLVGTDVRRVEFHRSLIRSDARLTYGQVDEVFAGTERAAEPWAAPLAAAREVAAALRARRTERGALEVNSPEPSFDFDGAGHVAAVRYEEQTESHTLIEELMILANEQVAGYLADRKLPTLYRVHERPDPPSVEAMIAQLASLDVPTPPVPRNMSPQQAADVAAEASRMAAAFSRSHRSRAVRVQLGGAALAQAGLLLPAQPGPCRPRQPAVLPLHVADSPLSRPGGTPGAAHRPGSRRRGAAGGRARGGRHREQRARARGDEDRAHCRRRVPGLPAGGDDRGGRWGGPPPSRARSWA